MRLSICLCIILVLAASLQGCGRKGPLTLPKSAVASHAHSLSTSLIPAGR
ncbi:MAG: lipoprotein [Gallionella sp.]|nr:lipoprotein [Gallionella sp.]MDD4945652.1 lipoprotein [Gallionella sp.]